VAISWVLETGDCHVGLDFDTPLCGYSISGLLAMIDEREKL
jgi:hypothetical protein